MIVCRFQYKPRWSHLNEFSLHFKEYGSPCFTLRYWPLVVDLSDFYVIVYDLYEDLYVIYVIYTMEFGMELMTVDR